MIDYDWQSLPTEPMEYQELKNHLPSVSALEKRAMALLSRGFYGYNRKVNIVSGSWFLAQPLGVIKGKDMRHKGKLRSIDRDAIEKHLATKDILLFSNLIIDKQGTFYSANGDDMLVDTVLGLRIDKLISYVDNLPAHYRQMALDLEKAKALCLSLGKSSSPQYRSLQVALNRAVKCCSAGVERAHVLPNEDGALFEEILTADGCGLMVNLDNYETLITAEPTDINEIKKLISPWEDKEALRPRSYEDLAKDINNFRIIKHDDIIIGCAALSSVEGVSGYAELECVVVKDSHKHRGYGKRLLNSMEKLAATRGYKHLMVLTTQASTWFEEAGYKPTKIKFPVHEECRNSKNLVKDISKLKGRVQKTTKSRKISPK